MAKQKRDMQQGVQDGLRIKAKAARAQSDDEDHDEEQPAKKKKKKKKKRSNTVLYIGIGIAAAVMVLVVGGVSAYFLLRRPPVVQPQPEQQAKAELKQDDGPAPIRIIPRIEDGNPAGPTKKGGIGIVSNVRGAGYRTERRSELKQIALSYVQFADEYKGAGRTLPNFMDYIKTFGPIRDAVKDGYYKINFNARLESGSVIAYERDIDVGNRHLCALGDGSVDYVSLDKLKSILGKDP